MFSFFFFFQAEDGIRDSSVTGVQTCALPIWLLRDGVSNSHPVPYAGSIGRPNAKSIRSRRYVGVNCMTGGSSIEPFRIDALHAILQPDLFRRRDFNRIERDLEMACTGRECQLPIRRLLVPAYRDFLYIERWPSIVCRKSRNIYSGESHRRSKPELSVSGRGRGRCPDGAFSGPKTVGTAEHCIISGFIASMYPSEAARRKSNDARFSTTSAGSYKPDIVVLAFVQVGHKKLCQGLNRCIVFKVKNPACRCTPIDSAGLIYSNDEIRPVCEGDVHKSVPNQPIYPQDRSHPDVSSVVLAKADDSITREAIFSRIGAKVPFPQAAQT